MSLYVFQHYLEEFYNEEFMDEIQEIFDSSSTFNFKGKPLSEQKHEEWRLKLDKLRKDLFRLVKRSKL